MIRIKRRLKVKGSLFSGIGKGRIFTEIGWVREGIKNLLGFEPKPGTLNLKLKSEDFELINEIKEFGIPLESPDPTFCNAFLLPAKIGELQGCAIFPEKEVWVHKDTLEVLSPVILREELGLEDGDSVEVDLYCEISPELFVFDVDGTLVDSLNFYFHLAKLYAEPFGISVKEEDLRLAMNLGLGKIEEVLLPPHIEERDRIAKEIRSIDRETFGKLYAKDCHLFQGVAYVLSFLRSEQVKLALLTTNWDIDEVLEVFKKGGVDPERIFDSVKVVEEGMDKEVGIKSKLREIIAELGVPKAKTVYVGDGVINVKCAKELGISSIGVLTGVGKVEELEELHPDLILDSVLQLLDLNA